MEKAGGKATFVPTDVTSEEDIAALFDGAVETTADSTALNTPAFEVGKQGIRVNEIAPAPLMSDMVKSYFEGHDAIPLDDVIARLALTHVGRPEDGAAAVHERRGRWWLGGKRELRSTVRRIVLPVDAVEASRSISVTGRKSPSASKARAHEPTPSHSPINTAANATGAIAKKARTVRLMCLMLSRQ